MTIHPLISRAIIAGVIASMTVMVWLAVADLDKALALAARV